MNFLIQKGVRVDLEAQEFNLSLDTVRIITAALIKRYYTIFRHIDIDTIKFEAINIEKKPLFNFKGLNRGAIELLNETDVVERYILEVNEAVIDEYDINQVQWMLFKILCSINEDCNGVVEPFSFTSYTPLVELLIRYQLSTMYLFDPNLPDLLSEDAHDVYDWPS